MSSAHKQNYEHTGILAKKTDVHVVATCIQHDCKEATKETVLEFSEYVISNYVVTLGGGGGGGRGVRAMQTPLDNRVYRSLPVVLQT